MPGALVRALRPKQWLKNVLVFAAPVAAGVIREDDVLLETAGAFAAWRAYARPRLVMQPS